MYGKSYKIEILLAERYGVRPESARLMIQDGIIRECELRNYLILEEYKKRINERKGDLRADLADKYCVSISMVEKIVFTQ